ncbi:uncharacterized protein [Watersipora subatra]|uniref:uncharacterized protein n=1 Tax=Watersipora subatra TaxID=2589382 RepID=UPI00355BA68A
MEVPINGSYTADEAPVSLGDVLSDRLVQATQFMLLYVTEDGQHVSLCIGNTASIFNSHYSVTQSWTNFKENSSVVSPKYQCLNCVYTTNYLHSMSEHHKASHPELAYLKNDQKWISHFSKFTNRQPIPEADKAPLPLDSETSSSSSHSMNKYNCDQSSYKSTYYQNLNDHTAVTHDQYPDTTGKPPFQADVVESNEGVLNSLPLTRLSQSGSEDEHQGKDDDAEECDLGNLATNTDLHQEDPPGAQSKPNVKSNTICEFCNQQFEHKRLKDIHVTSFHRVGDCYRCPYCKQEVPCQDWPEHLKKHSVTAGEAYCEQCCKKFKSMRNLKNHRLEVHEEGKIHPCPEPGCSSVFARARNLRSHLALHQGSKQHVCNICGEGYALKSSLGKHRKSKHPEEAAMPNHKVGLPPGTVSSFGNSSQLARKPSADLNLQVQDKVVVTPRSDGSLLVKSKSGDRVDFTQQGAVLVLPQAAPGDMAPQIEGTVVVMQPNDAINGHFTRPLPSVTPSPPSSIKRVIKRQSYLDLSSTKMRRQSSLDLGMDTHMKTEISAAGPTTLAESSSTLPRCRYCQDLYFHTKEELKIHVREVHKVTSTQEAEDIEASKNCRPEAKLLSQFSNTPHTQLSQDLIEAAYLLSLQHEQQMQDGSYMDSQLSGVDME